MPRTNATMEIVCDPDDDHVLAAALGAKAQLIVTRDRDLLTLGTFNDITILPAAQALARIPASPTDAPGGRVRG
ncbi:MAG: PIN domain-containing protein [Steroidobacteraceae bacterium]|nr:PIN domain-containing protein [Steroidobacteraceae bacterium]